MVRDMASKYNKSVKTINQLSIEFKLKCITLLVFSSAYQNCETNIDETKIKVLVINFRKLLCYMIFGSFSGV